MIRYSLTCKDGHSFDSWFQSGAAYDGLAARGLVTCAICGTTTVDKALMAPALGHATTGAVPGPALAGPTAPNQPPPGLTSASLTTGATATELERQLAALRRHVEENADYVGLSFAAEARAMHEGSTPERAIYGEARADEARALIEDGIAVSPLPFLPKRHAN